MIPALSSSHPGLVCNPRWFTFVRNHFLEVFKISTRTIKSWYLRRRVGILSSLSWRLDEDILIVLMLSPNRPRAAECFPKVCWSYQDNGDGLPTASGQYRDMLGKANAVISILGLFSLEFSQLQQNLPRASWNKKAQTHGAISRSSSLLMNLYFFLVNNEFTIGKWS